MTGPVSSRPVVVITGAGAGVGRACVRRFAGSGYDVALLGRGPDGLDAAAEEVRAACGQAIVVPTDVADAEAVEAAAAQAEETLGPIDVWVNNAMVSVFSPVRDLRAEEVRRVTDVTYLGVVHGTLSALARMLPRDCGSIVQVGSALSRRSIPLQAAYCGAKHAIKGFSESLRCELLHDHSTVRVSMVQLPALNTPQFSWSRTRLPCEPKPAGPVYQPEIAAAAILWAAEHGPRELKVGAPTSLVLLADKFAPGLLDRYFARVGVRDQQTAEPVAPDRPDNLWTPVPGDHGAHGPFDTQAHGRSLQLWLRTRGLSMAPRPVRADHKIARIRQMSANAVG